jgi:uncharacterized membrane protein YgcG
MYTNKKSLALASIVIIMAIALVTAGSLTSSAFAAKKSTSTTIPLGGKSASTGSTAGTSTKASLSKFISCLRTAGKSTTSIATPTTTATPSTGKLLRSQVTNCYDTVYGARSTGSSTGGSSMGSSTGGSTSTRGSSLGGSSTGGGTFPPAGTP